MQGLGWVIGQVVALLLLASVSVRAQDAVDLRSAVFYGENVSGFPVTATIERVEVRRAGPYRTDGIRVMSSGVAAWPDVWSMGVGGAGGALQYTTWICVPLDRLRCGGFIQHWRSEDGRGTGAAWLQVENGKTNWERNWAYDVNRWGPMAQYVPKAGDRVYVFLVAGNARTGQASEFATVNGQPYRARTNVVQINYPANDEGVFAFAGAPAPAPEPSPAPAPAPAPAPVITQPDPPSSSGLTLEALAARVAALEQRVDVVEARKVPVRCSASISAGLRIPLSCRLE